MRYGSGWLTQGQGWIDSSAVLLKSHKWKLSLRNKWSARSPVSLCSRVRLNVFSQVCGRAPASAVSWVIQTDAGVHLWAEPAEALIPDICRPSQGHVRPHRARCREAALRRADRRPCRASQRINRLNMITFMFALHSHRDDKISHYSHIQQNPSRQTVPGDLQMPDTSISCLCIYFNPLLYIYILYIIYF